MRLRFGPGFSLAFALLIVVATPSICVAQKAQKAQKTHEAQKTQYAKAEGASYSPYAGEEIPRNVYFGDTHVHSSWSADAGNMGNRRIGPDDAYRFARGEEVTAHNGMRVRLKRPLDFFLLSDHAEYLGVMNMLDRSDPALLATEVGGRWGAWRSEGKDLDVFTEFGTSLLGNYDMIESPALERTVWNRVIENAERWNAPGEFTALIGYEWTSTPGGKNLHRNVIFADGGELAGKVIPLSSFDDPTPEGLWKFMAEYEVKTGGRILAIPHNSNVSGGAMFAELDSKGRPIDLAYAKERALREPIVEATQFKGDSEAHPFLSPNDEFADYETWDRSALGAPGHENAWLEAEYVRPALKNGIRIEGELGINPFKFGLIGSTDAHTGLATAGEDNYWGKATKSEAGVDRWKEPLFPQALTASAPEGGAFQFYEWEMASSGYAAVWAAENTREAIFDAMMRRETYATTGPRITVRFFGGFDYAKSDLDAPDLARVGYAKGVPMGGDLSPRLMMNAKKDVSESPTFLVSALRDPEGANLDRIQIVKGWVDEQGATQERIFDVAVSDGRRINRKGRAKKAVGSTVDVENATWSNSIGAAALSAYWTDPDFDAALRAFYYVRVIEIPKPRWTAYDRKFFSAKIDKEVPMTTQDRAYTSAIWYTP